MNSAEDYYRLRDQRSVEYLGRAIGDLVEVYIAIDALSAQNEAGQLALLALANQVSRTSRRITFSVPDPDVRITARTPFRGATLGEVLLSTVRAVDPFGEFLLGARPAGTCVSIGLGAGVEPELTWYLGADNAIAHLSRRPVDFGGTRGTLRGAGLASCLGASAVLREQLGRPVTSRRLSAWNYAEGDGAAEGPSTLDPVDVGRVLMVGAGAVGAAAAFWLNAFGVNGTGWVVADGDFVELHNTNRGLLFTAQHAGWPNDIASTKARIVAGVIDGATPCEKWFHECPGIDGWQFDVLLALANDYDARERLSSIPFAVSFQATTGENWLSQLHRHILGRDGCIWCRTGEIKTTRFSCSTTKIEEVDGTKSDAALPFLSASSGLMLTTALQRLAVGSLSDELPNCWSWDFASPHRMSATPAARPCKDPCPFAIAPRTRQRLVAGTRWAGLAR